MRRFVQAEGRRTLSIEGNPASRTGQEKLRLSLSSPIVFSTYFYSQATGVVAREVALPKYVPGSASSCSRPRPFCIVSPSSSLLSFTSPSSTLMNPHRSISYAAGLFHYRMSCEEVYPFPTRQFPGGAEEEKQHGKEAADGSTKSAAPTSTKKPLEEEGENLVMLISQLTEGNPTSARQRSESDSRVVENKNEKEGIDASQCAYYGARISSEYGGLGLGCTSYAYVCEEAGRAGKGKVPLSGTTATPSPSHTDVANGKEESDAARSSIALSGKAEWNPMLGTIHSASLAVFLLNTWGSKELKGKHLTQLSDGSGVFGWAVAEGHGGSPDWSMNTTVARIGQSMMTSSSAEEEVASQDGAKSLAEEDPNAFYITGEKLCPFAENATHFVVLAKTSAQVHTPTGPTTTQRSAIFLVPKDTPGVEVRGVSSSAGTPPCSTTTLTSPLLYPMQQVVLRNAKAEAIVGNAGEGFRMQLISTMTEQFAWAAALLGTLKAMYQEVEEVAKAVNGKTDLASASSASYQPLLAYAMPVLYAMESSLYAVTANMDRKASDTLLELCFMTGFVDHHAVLLLEILTSCSAGGIVTSSPLKDLTVFARTLHALRASLPPLDYLRAIAISCGVEEFGLQFQATSTMSVMQKRMLRSVGVREKLPIQGIDCTALDASLLRFATTVEKVFLRHTNSLSRQQLVLSRLGEAGELAYVATTAASRASMALQKDVPTAKTEKVVAEAFLEDATRRIQELCDLCCHSGKTADDVVKRIALQLCDSVARGTHKITS